MPATAARIRGMRIATLALAACLLTNPAARADTNIRAEMSEVAKSLKLLLADAGQNQIAVRDFEFKGSDSKLKGAAGPGIAKFLTEELEKQKLSINPDAPFQVRGTYVDVIDTRSKLLAAQIKGQVTDVNDKVVTTFTRGIFGDQALASLFGTTGNLTPTDDVKTRSEELTKAIDNPAVQIDGSRITTTKGTPYAIELLVKKGNDYVPRPAVASDGQAFVKIDRSEIYALKLINDTDQEASVAVTIDGLSMFAFSENKNYTQVIIPAKSFGLIKGWHRSNELTDSFKVVSYSDSEVAKLLPTSTSVGVVTAAFSVCFPDDVPPPEDEPPSSKVKPFARSADATGRGPEVKEKFTEVHRNFGVVRTTISARYSK